MRSSRDPGGRHGRVGLLVLAALLTSSGAAWAERPERRPTVRKGQQGTRGPGAPGQWRGTFFWSSGGGKRGYLGVVLHPMTRELRKHFGAPDDAGVLLAKVDADSPAQKAGLQVGDVVLEVAGQRVATIWDVALAVRHMRAGDLCRLKVVRGGKELALQARLVERSRPQVDMSPFFRLGPDRGDPNLQLDARSFEEAMKQLRKQMKDLGSHRELFQYFQQERDLEQRLRQMEQKLRALEKRLQSRRSTRPRPDRPTAA